LNGVADRAATAPLEVAANGNGKSASN